MPFWISFRIPVPSRTSPFILTAVGAFAAGAPGVLSVLFVVDAIRSVESGSPCEVSNHTIPEGGIAEFRTPTSGTDQHFKDPRNHRHETECGNPGERPETTAEAAIRLPDACKCQDARWNYACSQSIAYSISQITGAARAGDQESGDERPQDKNAGNTDINIGGYDDNWRAGGWARRRLYRGRGEDRRRSHRLA